METVFVHILGFISFLSLLSLILLELSFSFPIITVLFSISSLLITLIFSSLLSPSIFSSSSDLVLIVQQEASPLLFLFISLILSSLINSILCSYPISSPSLINIFNNSLYL